MDVLFRSRPEILAGGMARDDTTVQFYMRVAALASSEDVVLDLGAGRGVLFDGPEDYKRSIARLKGRVKRLAGCDVDPAVLKNTNLDDAQVVDPAAPLPYADETFDLIYSDWVIEHVDNPARFVFELRRVLKPGGWFCARTPNKWGYVALGARLVPSAFEKKVLHRLQPDRLDHDVFPKWYRLNTLGQIRRAFPESDWINASFPTNATPAYYGQSAILFHAIDWYQKLTPAAMNTMLLVFMQKRG